MIVYQIQSPLLEVLVNLRRFCEGFLDVFEATTHLRVSPQDMPVPTVLLIGWAA